MDASATRTTLNLPNALTIARIAITPLIAFLPFAASWTARFIAFVLFLAAAISDYADGVLARSRKQETNLGRLLDPLADKLLLLGTFIPMFALAGSGFFMPRMTPLGDTFGVMRRPGGALDPAIAFPFVTPVGNIPLPWWIVVLVLGREVAMTIFRQAAHRRGVVISAIGPAKWKTTLQLIWQGCAYCWFFAATLAMDRHWMGAGWRAFALFNGSVGALAMTAAVLLTLYSLWLYVARYGYVFARR
ncbi:MAG TPA: CDP-alcohol phosphatidyltransferase family protein [Gemmatimonadaceae bacterium]|nr:CDP-alcohol phosphatidyltransferase family protein [Gemmatimonadaceae bacterium]